MEENPPEECGIGASRTRRERTSKGSKSRFEALAKLKETRSSGKKNSYELKETENVYDMVDEKEYAQRVRKRREEDWIVDDDGNYAEDGREIFDEDEEVSSQSEKTRKTLRKREPNNKKSLKNMLLSMPAKKASESDLKNDEILDELLTEVKKTRKSSIPQPLSAPSPKRIKTCQEAVNPFRRLSTGVKRPKAPKETLQETPEPSQESEISPSQNITEFNDEEFMDFSNFDEMDIKIESSSPPPPPPDVEKKLEDDVNFENKENSNNRGFIHDSVKKEQGLSNPLDNWALKTQDESDKVVLPVDLGNLPVEKSADGERILYMYWLDAYEDIKVPGVIWLFGKVYIKSTDSFASCCITVKNIQRVVYFLKREVFRGSVDAIPTIGDVYNEVEGQVAKKFGISEFKSRPVSKLYAFEIPDVPREAEYLEFIYSSKFRNIDPTIEGDSFSRVFGGSQGFLENFLLSRKLKGPCWLEIKEPNSSSPSTSWSKFEAVVDNPYSVRVATNVGYPVPTLTVMSLNMKTVINPKTFQNEIVSVSAIVQQNFPLDKTNKSGSFSSHFVALTRPVDVIWPFDVQKAIYSAFKTSVTKMDSERALLAFLLAKIVKIDPDVIVGYDMPGFDMEIIFHRTVHNKIPNWSRLGRLKRSSPVSYGIMRKALDAFTGRLSVDLKISAKELIRCKSYDMPALFEKILNIQAAGRAEFGNDEVKRAYDNSGDLMKMIASSLNDASYVLQSVCELNVIPLALQITQIAGNVLSRTLLGGRAERNEYLLLHAFTEKNFVIPDKNFSKRIKAQENDEETTSIKSGRKKPAYAGGLVLEPKKGFYDKYVLLMDFNSLYPSIIQEYNICFTTVERVKSLKSSEDERIPELPREDAAPGVLPTEIRKLVESRNAVKKLLKNPNITPDQRSQYDIRQKALKLTANSMYGCLGFGHSRFYAKPIAALITSRGREILLRTKDLVEKNMNLEVIYGDTDSIMINSNSRDFEEVYKLGSKIKSEVNKLYKLLELDIDGVYKYMLLLKKKKYAAISVEKKNGQFLESTELKGLDIVRRDWAQLASDTGKYILENIMKDIGEDDRISLIHEKLEAIGKSLSEGDVALTHLAITKQLTKDPEDYPNSKSLPHVQVAIRMNKNGGKPIKSGDTVPYVICSDGTDLPATQRAYHVDEVAKEGSGLKVDTHYYLAQQLHPVVSRICDPLDGTDSSRIAKCLGLDPDQYKKAIRDTEVVEDREMLLETDKFRLCEKFVIKCKCGELITLDSISVGHPNSKDFRLCLTRCPKPGCALIPLDRVNMINNALVLNIRQHISRYYSGWIVCEDPGCPGRTRQIPLRFQRSFPICPTCEKATMYREYSDVSLYNQLLYYSRLFDLKFLKEHMSSKKADINDDLSRVRDGEGKYNLLFDTVQKSLNYNNYSVVALSKVFDGLMPLKADKMRSRHHNG